MAGLISAACCDDHVRAASASFLPNLTLGVTNAWVGDTSPIYAAALSVSSGNPIWCSGEVYNSTQQPGRFQYVTTDPAVAIIDAHAQFVALQAGVTRLVTTTAGVRDSMLVIVGPAVGSLRVSATPLPAHVGDTITVQLEARDRGGSPLNGAEVALLDFVPGSDSLAQWIRTIRAPRPFPSATFPSPLSDRLVLRRAGVLLIVGSAPHDVGQPPWYVADTLALTITAP